MYTRSKIAGVYWIQSCRSAIIRIDELRRPSVGAGSPRPSPIMYFQKLKWIIEEALAAHRPIAYSALFFETALSAFAGYAAILTKKLCSFDCWHLIHTPGLWKIWSILRRSIIMSLSEALAFDMYGTLVDPIRIWKQLEQYIPQNAQRIAEIWRKQQLEFTFRLTAMHRYEDFEQVTRKALAYALSPPPPHLHTPHKDSLMAQYNDLERFDDVEPGLQHLKDAGYTMVIFSNGSPSMLPSTMRSPQLNPYFQGFVSVD